jgi:hypothetical protein
MPVPAGHQVKKKARSPSLVVRRIQIRHNILE